MADLPEDLIQMGDKVFTHAGVECLGPFYANRGLSVAKKYGVVFTCLATQSAHIEIADSLSTYSLRAQRRFLAHRGNVRSLCSDQDTNFIGAGKELRKEIFNLKQNEDKIKEVVLHLVIK